MNNVYLIVKRGLYDHGVMWIGQDLQVGKKRADYFASNIDDGHHDYDVRLFKEPKANTEYGNKDWTDSCELIYTGVDNRRG